uniref:Female reproductive tract protease GLEANR_897 n=1 Tax=Drosophila mojavensis TaxID=7230 RepID=C7BA72_DROMO|nr:female reproductive tract protease GLEANR_897 [Drosophila mojavensis]
MSVKLVTFLLLQTAVAVLAGVRSFNELFRQPPRIDGRIVGGQPINITDAPYQISLQLVLPLSLIHDCGGSLISKEWILTAAHCTYGRKTNQLRVRLGSSESKRNGQLLDIKKIVNHKKYNYVTTDYDFSLLQLQEPIEFDATKQAVKLPKQGQEFKDGEMCYVSGWGKTLNPEESDEWLRQVKVPLVNQEECRKQNLLINIVTDSMICAGYMQGGKDACQGDSGGPLVNGNGVLVGVVSWGKGCALPNHPGVYGRVSYVREWIRKHSGV